MNSFKIKYRLSFLKKHLSFLLFNKIDAEAVGSLHDKLIYAHILLKYKLSNHVNIDESELFNKAISLLDAAAITRKN